MYKPYAFDPDGPYSTGEEQVTHYQVSDGSDAIITVAISVQPGKTDGAIVEFNPRTDLWDYVGIGDINEYLSQDSDRVLLGEIELERRKG